MVKQRKTLYAQTKAKEMYEKTINFYDICKTLKVYRNSDLDKMLVEDKNNKYMEELKQKKRELSLQAKKMSKLNSMLLKESRRRKQFEQEMVA